MKKVLSIFFNILRSALVIQTWNLTRIVKANKSKSVNVTPKGLFDQSLFIYVHTYTKERDTYFDSCNI